MEARIISQWRRSGAAATTDARENVQSIPWCVARIENDAFAPLSRGDLALIMEYAPDASIRLRARQLVHFDAHMSEHSKRT